MSFNKNARDFSQNNGFKNQYLKKQFKKSKHSRNTDPKCRQTSGKGDSYPGSGSIALLVYI